MDVPRDPFCCQDMWEMVSSAGRSGLSIVWTSRESGLTPLLQSRACGHENIARFDAILKGLPPEVRAEGFPVRIAEQIPIRSCPFCGMRLDVWAGQHPDTTRAMVQEQNRFDLRPQRAPSPI